MTQTGDAMQKEAALRSILSQLDDKGKDSALAILKALGFAQAVMNSKTGKTAGQEKRPRPTRAG